MPSRELIKKDVASNGCSDAKHNTIYGSGLALSWVTFF